MSKRLQHFLPDIDPTVAVIQAYRFESVHERQPARNKRSAPIVTIVAVALLVVAGWMGRSLDKKTLDSASIEVSTSAHTLASANVH